MKNVESVLGDVKGMLLNNFSGNVYVHLLIIAVLSIAAYSNTFNVPFVLDDKPSIIENPIVKDFSYFREPSKAKGLEIRGVVMYEALKSRYIGYLSFAVNHRLHGLDVTGYHVVNLIIHILSAFLVYYLSLLTFRTPALGTSCLKERSHLIALFSALLFAVHPLQTQAVTYIVQRFASLAALFYLSSLVCYIQSRLSVRDVSRYVFYVLSFISAVSAMKTKEVAFTLPVAIVSYEFIFFRDKISKRLLYLLPILLTMIIIPLTFIDLDRPVGELMGDIDESTTIREVSRTDYLMTEFRVIVTYIRLLFFPAGQNLDYDYPVYHSFFDPQVFLSFLFLVGIFSLGIFLLLRSRSRDSSLRLMAFGIFWFFITLSVESGIIPLHVIYEHRIYLPSAGIFMAISTFIFLAVDKPDGKKKAMVISVLSVLIFVLAGVTYARNVTWGSGVSLWEDVVEKSPDKARGHNNLGIAYKSGGLNDKAIEQYGRALAINPYYIEAHNNIANAYSLTGRFDKAVEHYQLVLRAGMNSYYYGEANYNLAAAYRSMGMSGKAIRHYEIALKLDPGNIDAYNNLGAVYFNEGMIDRAVELFQKALRLKPDYTNAYFNLGEAYYTKGLIDKSIHYYQTFLQVRPDYAGAHYNIGVAYEARGLLNKAREHYRTALRLDPDSYDNLQERIDALNKK